MCDRLNTRSTPILAQRPEPHRWPPPILCALIRTLCRAAPYMQYLVHHHRRAPNSAGCTKCIYGIRAKYPAAWEPLGCTEPPKVRWMEARLDSDCTACIQAQLQCVAALHLHSSVEHLHGERLTLHRVRLDPMPAELVDAASQEANTSSSQASESSASSCPTASSYSADSAD